jgi:hypothetical protein
MANRSVSHIFGIMMLIDFNVGSAISTGGCSFSDKNARHSNPLQLCNTVSSDRLDMGTLRKDRSVSFCHVSESVTRLSSHSTSLARQLNLNS